MRQRSIVLAAILACALLGACRQVETNVETFNALPSDYTGKSVLIVPFKDGDENTLEFAEYRNALADELQAQGFRVVDSVKVADYAVFFGYAIDQGKQVVTTFTTPQTGVIGYSGTNVPVPVYGTTGYTTSVQSDVLYTRSVTVKILDVRSERELWSMVASSTGTCPSLRSVISEILSGAFEEFPETQGTVRVPSEGGC